MISSMMGIHAPSISARIALRILLPQTICFCPMEFLVLGWVMDIVIRGNALNALLQIQRPHVK
jgi:hypothetical protein